MPEAVQVADIQRIAEDARLTLEAKAILVYAVTRPASYRLTVPDLVATTAQARINAGPRTIYDRLKELIALGYVTRKLGKSETEYFIHAAPLSPVKVGKAA